MSTSTAAPTRSRRTQLDHYPSGLQRYASLGIVVVATIVLYYQFYLAGAVAAGTDGRNGILVDYDMSFVYYVNIAVVGYVLGAIASFATGVADRYGRVNIITIGLVVVALLCLLGIPLADSKLGFAIVFAAIGAVEGMILVATPALIRDFSPQLGRASAMGFWTLGPVLGSLVVSIQVSSTSNQTPWHHQYIAAGIVGLVVAVLSALFLRELSPALRDQIMVSAQDRTLVEARAAGLDAATLDTAQRHPFRQMLKLDIVASAFAISVFLIIYYILVGFSAVFFQTVFGYSQSRANSLGNYVWAFDAVALIIIGFASDRLRVRKPFMLVGAIGAVVMTAIFATRATAPDTSYGGFVVILVLLALFLGVTYAPWMASFTETVERRNPALTATGLAIWGLTIRIVIAVVVFIAPLLVSTVSTLVEEGAAVQAGAVPGFSAEENATVAAVAADPSIAARATELNEQYAAQIATAQALDPATTQALVLDPTDQSAGVEAVSELSGVPVDDVTTLAILQAQNGPALAAAQALDPATQVALLTNPDDPATVQSAVAQVMSGLGVSQQEAQARLQALAAIPTSQLLLLQQQGPAVAQAQQDLQALAEVPAADLAFLAQYAPLAEPRVQQVLTDVQAAAADSPGQWRTYFWIAVGGEVLFIPFIFLLAGAWSPREARRREREHEARVAAEMERLAVARST